MAALVINGSQDGMRIDRLLISEFRDSNILDIWKFIRNKEIRVNGRAVVQNYRVKCQDVVSYSNFVEKIMKSPLIRKSSRGVGIRKHNFTNLNTHSGIGLVTNNIIYEDDNLLVINKPYDLPVQSGKGIVMSVAGIISGLSFYGEQKLRLVHRLDRHTTGVLLIAKNIRTADELTKIFKTRNGIRKEYLLIVTGNISKKQGLIDFSLVKRYEGNSEKVYVDNIGGQSALTSYDVLAYSEKYDLSFVKAEILTGRTHQIRVHFREIGNSLLGDFKYGNRRLKRNTISTDKLQLHSYRTILDLFGKKHLFVANIPKHMKKILAIVFDNFGEILAGISEVL